MVNPNNLPTLSNESPISRELFRGRHPIIPRPNGEDQLIHRPLFGNMQVLGRGILPQLPGNSEINRARRTSPSSSDEENSPHLTREDFRFLLEDIDENLEGNFSDGDMPRNTIRTRDSHTSSDDEYSEEIDIPEDCESEFNLVELVSLNIHRIFDSRLVIINYDIDELYLLFNIEGIDESTITIQWLKSVVSSLDHVINMGFDVFPFHIIKDSLLNYFIRLVVIDPYYLYRLGYRAIDGEHSDQYIFYDPFMNENSLFDADEENNTIRNSSIKSIFHKLKYIEETQG